MEYDKIETYFAVCSVHKRRWRTLFKMEVIRKKTEHEQADKRQKDLLWWQIGKKLIWQLLRFWCPFSYCEIQYQRFLGLFDEYLEREKFSLQKIFWDQRPLLKGLDIFFEMP